MSNMSYCRWENTMRDLRDCDNHLTDDLSGSETDARRALIHICVRILDGIGIEVDKTEDEINKILEQVEQEAREEANEEEENNNEDE